MHVYESGMPVVANGVLVAMEKGYNKGENLAEKLEQVLRYWQIDEDYDGQYVLVYSLYKLK